MLPPLCTGEISRTFEYQPISSELDQHVHEQFKFAVEGRVRNIILELPKIASARDEFRIYDGVWFDNYAHSLD